MMAPGTDVVLGSLDTLVPLVVAAFGVGVIAGALTMGLLALRFRRAERLADRSDPGEPVLGEPIFLDHDGRIRPLDKARGAR